jgi:hypothetical protein
MLDKPAGLFPDKPDALTPTSSAQPTAEYSAVQERRDDSDDFNWNDDPSIILRPQPGVAVYYNKANELVIRQEALPGHDEDHFVYVTSENQDTFIDKLTDALGIPSMGAPERK